MKFQLIDEENRIWAKIDDDGRSRLTCSEQYPELQAWLAEQDDETLA